MANYDPGVDMSDKIKGLSLYEAKNGLFKKPTIIKIWGEEHARENPHDAQLYDNFFKKELDSDPNSKLFIEAEPELAVTGYLMNDSAHRMKRLFHDRVFPIDIRREARHRNLLKYTPNIVEKRRAMDYMKRDTEDIRRRFPKLNDVWDDFDKMQERPLVRHYAVPYFDAEILHFIQDARKNQYNPIFYVGDGHRKNIHRILEGDKEIVGNGIALKKRRKPKKEVDIKIKNPGSLKAFGYESKLPTKERRDALKRAVKEYGHEEVVKKITAISTLNKNKPVGGLFESDKNWLEKLR